MIKSIDQCPCCSGKSYATCCKPFHTGKFPANALQLMRSRYSAYALHLAEYIMETTHNQNASFSQDKVKWKAKILEFTEHTQFEKLDILNFQDGEAEAYVTFVAHLKQGDLDAGFQEKSRFLKVGNRWLYVDGSIQKIGK